MKRTCKTCRVSIEHKKSNAKYCSADCKTRYWLYGENYNAIKNAKNGEVNKREFLVSRDKKVEVKKPLSPPLRGVLDDGSSEVHSPKTIPNPIYRKLQVLHSQIEQSLQETHDRLIQEETSLSNLLNSSPVALATIGGTTLGGFAEQELSKEKNGTPVLGMLLGGFTGLAIGQILKEKYKKEIEKIKGLIKELKQKISLSQGNLNKVETSLKKTAKLIPNPNYTEPKQTIPLPLPANDIQNKEFAPINSQKVICSTDLKGMNFRSLDFRDNWLMLLGNPSVNFKMAVFGKPGQGKSTFCFQFAKYLAQNFGRVLFVSGEEGFSKTLKDKVVNNKAENKNLYVGNIKDGEELIQEVPQNTYHFIILDSLNNMRIDEQELLRIEEHYSNCAVISISQSTKKGEMRGSQEILHNVDIVVRVESGKAECIKNRFAQLGFEYRIF